MHFGYKITIINNFKISFDSLYLELYTIAAPPGFTSYHQLVVTPLLLTPPQAEDLLSRSQQLRELITQSESIILINLDSQRNIMMRLSLQLEMGVFSATMCGLVGLSFGMNLSTSLEEVSKIVRVLME